MPSTFCDDFDYAEGDDDENIGAEVTCGFYDASAAEQEDDDDGDRDRDADDHYGVEFLGCLQATVVTGLEFVVYAVRRARKLAMHTQTTRNKNTQSCVLLFDLCVCSAAFDKRGSGAAGFHIPHASV